MSWTAAQEANVLSQIADMQDTIEKIFNMLNNTTSAKEMRQLTYVRQKEISDILDRLTSLEAEVRSLSTQVSTALNQ